MSSRKLTFITGTRADFGKLDPLAVRAKNAGFEIEYFVTGMHMLSEHGMTKYEVMRQHGDSVYQFCNQKIGDSLDQILCETISGLSDFLAVSNPDLVVVHGDRIEALAALIVSSTNYFRVAHIEGGEVSGTIDELFRHCCSKLATYHFVSSQDAANRLKKLGEEPKRIHVIGSPELDYHKRQSTVTLCEVKDHYDIQFDDFAISIFHPVTSELDNIQSEVQQYFHQLERSGKNFVIILPNNDPGSEHIFDAIKELPKKQFRALPSMRFSYFSELLKQSSLIIGNSSTGVREAPFLGLPSINVGSRQKNRSSSASIINVPSSNLSDIAGKISLIWNKRFPMDTEFGAGNASEAFVKIISVDSFWEIRKQKHFVDV